VPKQATDNVHSPHGQQFSLKCWQSETSRNMSQFSHTVLLRAIFTLFSHIMLRHESGLFPWKPSTVFIHAYYYIYHQTRPYLLFCNVHKLRRSSLCNILHPHDTFIFLLSTVRTLLPNWPVSFLASVWESMFRVHKNMTKQFMSRSADSLVSAQTKRHERTQPRPCPSIRPSVSTL
jgi:hypothetical protein